MEKEDLKYKDLNLRINNLEKKIEGLEDKESGTFDNNSFIALFLDVFNFKKFLEIILRSQKRYTITEPQIYIILLFIFLSFIFWQTGILYPVKSSTITILGLIFAAICFEFLGANTSIFKFIFSRDTRTKSFIDKIPSMSYREIKNLVINQNFSPQCMDYFIKSLENKDKYSPDLVYLIIDNQVLRSQNLDLLFSEDIIKNLQEDLIIRVLFIKRNSLKIQHIQNIYDTCKNNTVIIKILIATQKYCDGLLKDYPENKNEPENKDDLFDYYEKYQTKKIHIDWKLKLIPISHFRILSMILIVGLLGFSAIFLFIKSTETGIPIPFYDFLKITAPVILLIFIKPFFSCLYEIYYNHYINNISSN